MRIKMYNCPSVRLSQAGRSTQAAERIELVVGVKASFPLILHGILHHSIYTVKHITDAARIVLDSGAEGPWFKSQPRQTVHTRRASVYQAEKLAAALLRVARVAAGLAESNGSLLPGL